MTEENVAEYILELPESWEISPEPDEGVDLLSFAPEDGAFIASMGAYDNIGDALTADTIEGYLDSKSFSRTVWMTVLHNSGTPASADAGLATVRSFYNYHVHTRGWKSIGYHFVISTKGVIYAARQMGWTGAHAGTKGNPHSIGVCLVGNFESGDKPTQAQKIAFARLHTELHRHYYGQAKKTARFHREFMSTGCPGKITVGEVMDWVDKYGEAGDHGTSSKPLIRFDGKALDKGRLIDGSTYAPLRSVFEAAGFDVKWISTPHYRVMLTSPGKDTGWINDWDLGRDGSKPQPLIVLDGKVLDRGKLIDGSTYAPLRSVFEAASFGVKWVGSPTWEVLLTSPR